MDDASRNHLPQGAIVGTRTSAQYNLVRDEEVRRDGDNKRVGVERKKGRIQGDSSGDDHQQ